jgi:hypothetical protein
VRRVLRYHGEDMDGLWRRRKPWTDKNTTEHVLHLTGAKSARPPNARHPLAHRATSAACSGDDGATSAAQGDGNRGAPRPRPGRRGGDGADRGGREGLRGAAEGLNRRVPVADRR